MAAYEEDSNQTNIHGQPWKRKSRQLLERAEDEEDVTEQLQGEDDEVAQVQVCRLARRVEPCSRVTGYGEKVNNFERQLK